MNKTDEFAINLAEQAINTMTETINSYKLGLPHNVQLDVDMDTNNTANYSRIKLEIAIHHNWEV